LEDVSIAGSVTAWVESIMGARMFQIRLARAEYIVWHRIVEAENASAEKVALMGIVQTRKGVPRQAHWGPEHQVFKAESEGSKAWDKKGSKGVPKQAHLWPEALTETTFSRRKSHLRSG
jgi:hypothetical protein